VKLKQFAETQKGQQQTTTSSRQYQLTLFDVQLWEKGSLETRQKLEGETQHRWSEVVNTLARPIKKFCHQFVFFLKGYISKGLQIMIIFSEKDLGKYFVFYN